MIRTRAPRAPRGWVRYPQRPDRKGLFYEDLQRINALIGSCMYESQYVNGLHYIRRVT